MKIEIPTKLLDLIRPEKVEDLLDEINHKNHVEVAVYRGVTGSTGLRHKRESYEQFGTQGGLPSLWQADAARALRGEKPVYMAEVMRRHGAELVGSFPNLRTNVGYDYCAQQLSGAAVATTNVATWIALSNNTTAPAATSAASTVPWSSAQASDAAASGTTGEYTALGVARASGAYAHTVTGPASSTTSYTVTKTFTATGTITSLIVAGLFGGTASNAQGTSNTTNMLFLSSTFTATSLVNTDQLALTWTVNI